MKTCPKCGAVCEDSMSFCSSCGASLSLETAPIMSEPGDHTGEFTLEDIRENKLFAMLVYLIGPLGVIVALLAAPKSDYVRFHTRESLKLFVCEMLVGLVTGVLCWTVIVPVLGGLVMLVLMVLHAINFVRVCKGLAKETPLVQKISFLR